MEEITKWLLYGLLGAIQGITEPIPISSSGHLVLAQEFLNIGVSENDFTFEILMNFASLLAVLLVYRSDLILITKNAFKFAQTKGQQGGSEFRFVIFLVVATIPAGVIGLLFEEVISDQFKGVRPIGYALLVTALALWIIRNLKGYKGDNQLRLKDAILIGCAQAVALIPGISRSGATIVAGMGIGLKRDTALKFSFMLYIPISLGTMIMKLNSLDVTDMLGPYVFAFVLSFVLSFYSLKWFMGVMEKGNLKYFSMYCVMIGLAVIVFS